ncbi:hypothetical protein AFL01nite_04850 [Aeromicrobium flavum]|uniref:Uncharacterized protein n=1 Tax=Aeromicrobium flavum TaxID=416568 RepID=A0A512HRU0_9ACTN|nr:hypothetical protein [Aeromicrobium flavum]GEO88158.1 hypothetical protein AFL01nite_04850 [Aeromicrobium flavum]
MTPEEAALVCPDHGGYLSHAFIHEAAHAIVAIDRGLPFVRITVGTPESFDPVSQGFELAGGLSVPEPISEWIQPEPIAAFEMIIAGKVAEEAFLGHHLEAGWHGDLALWCRGMEMENPTVPLIKEALGTSLGEVSGTGKTHLVAQYSRVRAIITAMTGIEESGATELSYDAGPWSMDHDEAVVVAGPAV